MFDCSGISEQQSMGRTNSATVDMYCTSVLACFLNKLSCQHADVMKPCLYKLSTRCLTPVKFLFKSLWASGCLVYQYSLVSCEGEEMEGHLQKNEEKGKEGIPRCTLCCWGISPWSRSKQRARLSVDHFSEGKIESEELNQTVLKAYISEEYFSCNFGAET